MRRSSKGEAAARLPKALGNAVHSRRSKGIRKPAFGFQTQAGFLKPNHNRGWQFSGSTFSMLMIRHRMGFVKILQFASFFCGYTLAPFS